VSVNSFGFGGTNSHAILESYDPSVHRKPLPGDKVEDTPVVLPFTFSAASERTLGALLQKYQEYLESSPSVEPNDLAWSLLKKRSALMYRLTFSAPTISTLRDQIEEELLLRKANKSSTIISRQKSQTKRILGVFTGQGAQWPQMGLDLVAATPQARVWFEELQSSLDDLPIEHRPDFSLLEELSAPASSSRLHEAALSQPLCTAVQIVFINFLSAVGVSLDVVVGHSSGEIGAAYAAGLLTARDAIRIAYREYYPDFTSRIKRLYLLMISISFSPRPPSSPRQTTRLHACSRPLDGRSHRILRTVAIRRPNHSRRFQFALKCHSIWEH
jgi:acyl transferase domain-containing protein